MIPLGRKEDSRLEFKGAEALKEPEKIAREVVAMLNAEGGEVWVGLRDDGGRAVAVEPIADPEREERRLWDFLVDTIEPSLSDKEVKVQGVDDGEGTILQITVSPEQGHAPYAFLRKGGRHFVVRVGDRIRLMTREEVFRKPFPDKDIEKALQMVVQDRNNILAQKERVLWLRLQPVGTLSLDIQDPRLKELLLDPIQTGNRFAGLNFANFHYWPKIQEGKLVTHPEDFGRVEIRKDGGLVFAASLQPPFRKDEFREIWPPMLAEYVVSAFRIAHVIFQECLKPSAKVAADLVLSQIKGFRLNASAGIFARPFMEDTFRHANDFTLAQPLFFRFEEIKANPDRCGYRLIELVYEAFGIERQYIELFDASGRLILSE